MSAAPAQLLRAISGSHQAVSEAIILDSFQTGENPIGIDLPIVSGDVVLDGSADIRGTASLQTPAAATSEGASAFPVVSADPLAPYGNEIFLRRGVLMGNTTLWTALGYYRIDTPSQSSAPKGAISIAASDRMSGVIDNRLPMPRQFASSRTVGSVVSELVLEVYPSAVIEWDDATEFDLVGRAVITDEDRFKFLNNLVTSRGKVWYWDRRGVLVIRDLPGEGSSVFDVSYGEGGVLIEFSRRLTREGVYNGVVASGEAADTQVPVSRLVVDDNPLSPTRWGGPFGRIPLFFSSSLITSADQALAAASTLLRRRLGLPYSVDFSSIPNPALEPHDPVKIVHPDGFSTHIIGSVTIPLSAQGAMTATTREQAVILAGGG